MYRFGIELAFVKQSAILNIININGLGVRYWYRVDSLSMLKVNVIMISFIYCSGAINSLRKIICTLVFISVWSGLVSGVPNLWAGNWVTAYKVTMLKLKLRRFVASYSTGNIISVCLHIFWCLLLLLLTVVFGYKSLLLSIN